MVVPGFDQEALALTWFVVTRARLALHRSVLLRHVDLPDEDPLGNLFDVIDSCELYLRDAALAL